MKSMLWKLADEAQCSSLGFSAIDQYDLANIFEKSADFLSASSVMSNRGRLEAKYLVRTAIAGFALFSPKNSPQNWIRPMQTLTGAHSSLLEARNFMGVIHVVL